MASKKELVLADMATALSASTYIKTVTRKFSGFDMETGTPETLTPYDMPAVIVNDGDEMIELQTSGLLSGGLTKSIFTPEIVGYVYGETDYFTKLNELIQEVKLRLMAAPRRGGSATSTEITSVRTDRGRLAPYGAFTMGLQIIYYYETLLGG